MELYRCFACGKVVDDKTKVEAVMFFETPNSSGNPVYVCQDCLSKAKQGTLTCESLRTLTVR